MEHLRLHAKYILPLIAAVAILSASLFTATICFKPSYPRTLQVGDTWNYQVTFPDGKGYDLTETVLERFDVNGSDTYVIFADDDQHISTTYMWLTKDWHEIKLIKPQIGNLQASSVTLYTPPIDLIHAPLHVGDEWEVNSSSRTIVTFADNRTNVTPSLVNQRRVTLLYEQIDTPAGRFRTFKIGVSSSNSPFETIWFSNQLGQVAYAEFYNPLGETVTQTLTRYTLKDAQSANLIGSTENLTEVIFTTNPGISAEMKIYYD